MEDVLVSHLFSPAVMKQTNERAGWLAELSCHMIEKTFFMNLKFYTYNIMFVYDAIYIYSYMYEYNIAGARKLFQFKKNLISNHGI